MRLSYAAYFGGVEVAELQSDLSITPQFYQMQVSFHLVGVADTLFHAQGSSRADGRFQGDGVRPRELFSSGHGSGKNRLVQITYQGDQPSVKQLEPPLEAEREPVPPAEQIHTIDSLSAMAMLIHHVWGTGRCDSSARTFDGRWTSEIAVKTAGEEALEQSDRSPFNGAALRCTIEARQLAGFWRDSDDASLHKPHHATVWFARTTPGGRMLPVRIEIETRGFGQATLYLTKEAGS